MPVTGRTRPHFQRAVVGGGTNANVNASERTRENAGGASSLRTDGHVGHEHASAGRFSAADGKLRTSAIASAGPTTTKVPDLLGDWKRATVENAARDAARAEMWPDVDQALQLAAQQKGAPLDEDAGEVDDVVDAFFDAEKTRLNALTQTYLEDLSKHGARTIQRVVAEARPAISQRRDPFTPVALGDPKARARELILWESKDAMVLVDLFSPSAKALVVPKQPMMLPVDAPKGVLADLALLAAHVSDAFIDVVGTPPAGIWVNAPQDITVKQLHVHVLPDLPRYPAKVKDMLGDAVDGPSVAALFQAVAQSLVSKLGPST